MLRGGDHAHAPAFGSCSGGGSDRWPSVREPSGRRDGLLQHPGDAGRIPRPARPASAKGKLVARMKEGDEVMLTPPWRTATAGRGSTGGKAAASPPTAISRVSAKPTARAGSTA